MTVDFVLYWIWAILDFDYMKNLKSISPPSDDHIDVSAAASHLQQLTCSGSPAAAHL